MDSITVYKKEELEEAKNKGYQKIIVKGELAEKLYKARKVTTLSKTALGIVVAAIGTGVALTPFTGGTSLLISGITATTVGIATGVGTAAIIAASFFGITLLLAIFNGYDLKVKAKFSDGTVCEAELTKKV
jgi:hypothetical protein